ncbi:unnamed protein product, partial [Discosporangium mesarthrocarpum]
MCTWMISFRVGAFLTFAAVNFVVGWRVLIWPVFGVEHHREAVAHTLSLLTFVGLACVCLVYLATTDPGEVRKEVPQEIKVPSAGHIHTAAAGTGRRPFRARPAHTRYCPSCRHSKPVRCHHCRVCNRCTLRMDHHCHWLGRCVGQKNYKAYLLTLLYASVACWSMMWLLFLRVREGPPMRIVERLLLLLDGLLLSLMSMGLSYLVLWHAYLVSKNITTIEYYQRRQARENPAQFSSADQAPCEDFDQGCF